MLGSLTSDDGKAVRELKELLNNNITARSKAESDKMVHMRTQCLFNKSTNFLTKALVERMDQLEEVLSKKEKFLQVCQIFEKVYAYTAMYIPYKMNI